MPFGLQERPTVGRIKPIDRLHQSSLDRQAERARAVAQLQGGPMHGEEMALPPDHHGSIRIDTVTPTYYTQPWQYYNNAPEVTTGYYVQGLSNNTWETSGTAADPMWQYVAAANSTQTYSWYANPWPQRVNDYRTAWVDNWADGIGVSCQPAPPLTQEEADRRLAATRAEQHKTLVRRQKAVKKGRKLLLEVLTEVQKQEYARTKSFTVTGANGRIYKLRKGRTTHELDEGGSAIFSHCIHLPYSYIDEDTLVAVKMLLETDPKKFLEIANTSRLMASPLGITVPAIPQEMEDRATALTGGLNAINERFAALSEAAARARGAAERLGRAFETASEIMQSTIDVYQSRIQNAQDYGIYARELEHQVVAETVGPITLPPAARHQHVARILGHAEDITGVAVAA